MIRSTHRLALAIALALLGSGALVGPAASGEENAEGVHTCAVRLMHRGKALSGFRISLLAKGETHEHGTEGAPTTDASGDMAVRVEHGATTVTPYLERRGERLGWNLFVLAPIDARQRPHFCRDREVIELPDTLVRVNVTGNGRPLPGVIVEVDNVGVRLGGRRPPERGVVNLKAETGLDGSVEIPGLAPGVWKVLADTSQSEKHAEREIAIEEGASVVVDLAVVPHDSPPLLDDQREPEKGGPR